MKITLYKTYYSILLYILDVSELNGQLPFVMKIERANYAVIFKNEKVFIGIERNRFFLRIAIRMDNT